MRQETPGPDSPVLVSANYKMSFDRLRRELEGIDAWILVLDTKGINVWCAAGKGTFGTEELTARIGRFRLAEVVTHRTLILPQLSAPGVAGHVVKQRTGFRVVYGPVRAADLPAFLKAGNKATPEMRQVRFGFLDRLVLTPMELVALIKPALDPDRPPFPSEADWGPFRPIPEPRKGGASRDSCRFSERYSRGRSLRLPSCRIYRAGPLRGRDGSSGSSGRYSISGMPPLPSTGDWACSIYWYCRR